MTNDEWNLRDLFAIRHSLFVIRSYPRTCPLPMPTHL